MRARLYLALLLSLVVFGFVCDRGFRYAAPEWKADGNRYLQKGEFDGIEIRTLGLGGLVGSQTVTPWFEITNRTRHTMVIENATIRVGSEVYAGRLPGSPTLEDRTIPSSSTKEIEPTWDFGTWAVDALGTEPVVVLEFRVGDEVRTVNVLFSRVGGMGCALP